MVDHISPCMISPLNYAAKLLHENLILLSSIAST